MTTVRRCKSILRHARDKECELLFVDLANATAVLRTIIAEISLQARELPCSDGTWLLV